MKKYAFLGALALALLAALGLYAPAFAGSTSTITISGSAFTDLGAGPLKVESRASRSAFVVEADSQPSATSDGHLLASPGVAVDFPTPSHIWARAVDPLGLAVVAVTPYSDSYSSRAPAYCQATITVAGTFSAQGCTVPTWATAVFITPETGALRYRCDGTAPTAAIGQPIAQGQSWPLQGAAALAACSLIPQGGTVVVSVEFRG